ncbi:MAG: hypothetical protein DMF69_18080 [Acidobacteria bacterium]|nr:MAG: hypothetical protein DMF69_18080 [Acidobacteriota bacterium]
MKRKLVLAFRILLLTVLYMVCLSLAFALVIPRQQGISEAEQATILPALLALSFLNTAVLAYIVYRSRWTGWKMILTLCFVLFGVTTVMPQIETAVFVSLPAGLLPRLFFAGFLFAVVFSPLAVLILGRRNAHDSNQNDVYRLPRSAKQWFWKLSLVGLVYVFLYFTFGYFVAWQSPAVRTYYGGTDAGTFLAQMLSTLRDSPWLLLLQFFRGLLWAALAVPVILMMKGKWWEAGLAVALLFGVVMNTQLLLPNPLMPKEVRMAHLLETAVSNFIFGWALVWILRDRTRASRMSDML